MREFHPVEARTYFVTANTKGRAPLFRDENVVRIFLKAIFHYRNEGKFRVHCFTVMPDHFHLIISPSNDTTLERAIQLIRGGFSHRYGKEVSRREVWQRGYTDHRIRDEEDFITHKTYIEQNSVRAGLASDPREYKYGSAYPGYKLDSPPFLSG